MEHTGGLYRLYPLIQTIKVPIKMRKVFNSLLPAIFSLAIQGLYLSEN